MKIGNKIHKVRELKNITAKDMADRLDMTLSGYQRIERDEVSINIERLLEIAGIFEMKPDELLTFDEKMVFNNYGEKATQIGTNINNYPEKFEQLHEEKTKLLEDKVKLQEEMIEMLKEKIKGLEGR